MLIKVGTFAVTALMALSGLATLTVGSGLALFTGQTSNTNNTFTSANCFPGNTGLRNPSANAADSGGDNNGFELNPTFAYADGGAPTSYASNINGPADRHRYYNYNIAVNSNCAIKGIQVRLDWWLDSTTGTNSMSAQLSWNTGTSWTAAKADTLETTSEHTGLLGGSADTWGRTWTVAQLSNANFRVRLTSNCTGGTCANRDFSLDWVPVTIYYGPS